MSKSDEQHNDHLRKDCLSLACADKRGPDSPNPKDIVKAAKLYYDFVKNGN